MSEMHWKDLKETDFSVLKSLADQWGTYIRDMTAQAEIITEDVVKKHLSVENFESDTADDVRHQADLLADSIQDDLHEYAMVKIKATLEDAHDELVECQAQLFDLIEVVTGSYRFEGGASDPYVVISNGHTERIHNLDPDQDVMTRGGVTETMLGGDPTYVAGLLLDAAQQIADEYGAVLQAIMTRAHNSDDQAAAILKSIVETSAEQPPPLGATYDDLIAGYEEANAERNAAFLQELASGESEATATGVNDWWTSLSDEERSALIADHPELLGPLDGIPTDIRDGANRTNLENEIASLEQQIAEMDHFLENEYTIGNSNFDEGEYLTLKSELENLQSLQAALDAGTDSGEPLFLLNLDSADDGQAVVSVGNPDTADHTAVYVPGTTADLSGVGGLIGGADTLQADAKLAAQDEKTAVVMWLDYDAPDNAAPVVQEGPFPPEAWSQDQALDARSDLNSFLEGLDASHEGDAHTTLMGHSYGSTVAGATAAEYQVAADQFIDFASPGVAVDTADELSVGGDDVWSTRAEDDVIDLAVDTGAMGADPTSDEFGGNTFESDAIGEGGTEIHSGYLKSDGDDRNAARETMAQIITGQK